MKKVPFSMLLVSATILVFGILACKHELLFDPGPEIPPIPATNACSPDTSYYVNDVKPIIISNCAMAGCHDNITAADGIRLTTYNYIMSTVRAGDASRSKLYKSIIKTNDERMPPAPMPALTAAQKLLVKKWIDQGAKNNICVGRCDSTVFTFAGAVKPLMDNKCVGCHNPSNLGGNIDLSTYAGIKTVALNGKLLGSIKQQVGFSPMPPGGNKLSDCEIAQVNKWITNGTLNN